MTVIATVRQMYTYRGNSETFSEFMLENEFPIKLSDFSLLLMVDAEFHSEMGNILLLSSLAPAHLCLNV